LGEKSAPTRMGAQILNALTIVDTDVLIDVVLQISKAIDGSNSFQQNPILAISVNLFLTEPLGPVRK
jgi:hypothetical protein